jgi:hypothetical protein
MDAAAALWRSSVACDCNELKSGHVLVPAEAAGTTNSALRSVCLAVVMRGDVDFLLRAKKHRYTLV